jgi:hypothetical protein
LLASKDSVASLSLRVTHPGFDDRGIEVAFDRERPAATLQQRNRSCLNVPLKVEGLANNRSLQAVSGRVDMTSRWASASSTDVGLRNSADGYILVICGGGGGGFGLEPVTVRAAMHFEVIEASPIATMPVRTGVLSAGGAGRCGVVEDVQTYLRCTLAEPVSGALTVGLEYPGYRSFIKGFGDAGTFRLGPVLRQKFDGISFETPGGWPLDEALKRGDARFVLRQERVVGSMWRTLTYDGFEMPGVFYPPIRKHQ